MKVSILLFKSIKILLGVWLLLSCMYTGQSQNLIGGKTGDYTVILELQSTIKGPLVLRMTSAERLAITSIPVYRTAAPRGNTTANDNVRGITTWGQRRRLALLGRRVVRQ